MTLARMSHATASASISASRHASAAQTGESPEPNAQGRHAMPASAPAPTPQPMRPAAPVGKHQFSSGTATYSSAGRASQTMPASASFTATECSTLPISSMRAICLAQRSMRAAEASSKDSGSALSFSQLSSCRPIAAWICACLARSALSAMLGSSAAPMPAEAAVHAA